MYMVAERSSQVKGMSRRLQWARHATPSGSAALLVHINNSIEKKSLIFWAPVKRMRFAWVSNFILLYSGCFTFPSQSSFKVSILYDNGLFFLCARIFFKGSLLCYFRSTLLQCGLFCYAMWYKNLFNYYLKPLLIVIRRSISISTLV